jgi:hypothetical protein
MVDIAGYANCMDLIRQREDAAAQAMRVVGEKGAGETLQPTQGGSL